MYWSEEEEVVLMKEALKYPELGIDQWMQVARVLKTRTAKQCEDHYKLQKSRLMRREFKTVRHIWSKQEVDILLQYDTSNFTWEVFQKKYFPQISVG